MIYTIHEKDLHTGAVKLVNIETSLLAANRWIDAQNSVWKGVREYTVREGGDS